jgi:hypothetical protein
MRVQRLYTWKLIRGAIHSSTGSVTAVSTSVFFVENLLI